MLRNGLRVLFYLNGTQQKGTVVSSVTNPSGVVYVVRLLDGGQAIIPEQDMIGTEF